MSDDTPAATALSSSSSSDSVNLSTNSPYKIPNSTDNLKSDSESLLETELMEKRHLIEELIHNSNTGKEGDPWYLISTEYLNNFLHLPATSFEDLQSKLGPVDNTSIVDQNGILYPENNEPVETYNVSPEIFNYLADWFGTKGQPVCRCLIINPETGAKEVERFPPVFHIHQLGKRPVQNSYYTRHHNHPTHATSHPTAVSLSRTKTFTDLLDLIRVSVLKLPKRPIDNFRIWFIESKNIAEYTSTLTISNLIFDIDNKSLVHSGILKDTLKSQGIKSDAFHILVEVKDAKASHDRFPVNTYLNQIDVEQYDFDKLSSKSSGHLGLSNLGNTCYMNSALQCLLHVAEVNYYFLYNLYKRELNFDNPLGNHGDIANAFGNLLKQAFDPSSSKDSSITPREFKSTIGRYSSMFSGYMQQDSQEFLSWLLDALHEDLNRIHKKPYCEKPELKDEEINDPKAIIKLSETCWNQHKMRNDSVITDLFTGLYQSTLLCPDCSKTSITFDPFNDLTLPLPISKKWYHTFTIVDLSDGGILRGTRIMKLEVELNKTSNFDDLLTYLSDFLKVETTHLFLYEIFRNSFYSDFQLDYNRNKFMPISDIVRDSDEVHVYYVPYNPETDIIIPVYNTVEDPDKSYKVTETFGIPLFVTLNKESDVYSFGTIRQKLLDKVSILSKLDLNEEYNKIKNDTESYVEKKHYGPKDFPLLCKQDDNAVLVEKPPSDHTIEGDGQLDEEDEDGYISDISLANPFISADFGFTIKSLNGYSHKPHANFRNRYNFARNAPKTVTPPRVINVPLHKPTFNEFKPLSDQLPELKKDFYHYPTYDKKFNKEMEDLAEEVQNDLIASASDDTSKSNDDYEFVMLDAEGGEEATKNGSVQPPALPPRNLIPQMNSSDEDTEGEQNLGSLFDSTSTLPIPPPSSGYAESLKPSNENSPTNTPSEVELGNHPELITKDTILLCDWDYPIFEQCFVENQTWENIPVLPNPELEKNRAKIERQRKSKISLYDCLKSFSTPEILGEHDLWYCPRCKDHKRATKTIQVWSTGDILTIHLKRFHSARAFSDKIEMVVDFPIEGLDMSSYIANPEAENSLYDLIAVDNHYGGLGGGHYTASVKNFRDGNWYYFNDSRVTSINNPEEVITSAAYLLFYRKRTTDPDDYLGGGDLNNMIRSGHELYKKSLITKKASYDLVQQQVEKYTKHEEQIKREMELDRELEKRKLQESGSIEAPENGEETVYEDGEAASPNNSKSADNEPVSARKTRSFTNTKDSPNDSVTTSAKAKFKFDNDEDDYDYEDDSDNIRKQRLLSKENNNNKLVQIKSNGKQEVASSPIAMEAEYDSMGEDCSV
ncbi:peptidase C19, ubiquitin C-terminal hydrolase 2 [Scheffersomyces stipitis CBS 6054]|uniref:ubiquitinyl hydrolase 1 n=1 Tax=Scheffersomyces stipitis (strain ATCC 58785 / CBS 6054 / NBRC 10063 / NRRL Y-11545) TaxID=322104 RepID=A3LQK0_PICST|nr:peptidase C19, ubiquitin C-terminal hydrolase 2 [Scheffersomyces stipitis CBS 6054]ABN65218.2 peptidase C19, ubiquitin C-terminal hydrolase 2 [Scheffersomyces stipitis CBS 6054]